MMPRVWHSALQISVCETLQSSLHLKPILHLLHLMPMLVSISRKAAFSGRHVDSWAAT
jgi:hypothetical protein